MLHYATFEIQGVIVANAAKGEMATGVRPCSNPKVV
jgi:hypothetical protein